MEPYSPDLRRRVLAAWDAGVETLEEVAERFGVSVSFVTKLLGRWRDTGSLAAKPHAGGFASAVDEGALDALASLVREQPDATLAELRDRLAARCGVSVSVPVVCRAVAALTLPRKKSRCTRPSGTPRGCGGCGGRTPGR